MLCFIWSAYSWVAICFTFLVFCISIDLLHTHTCHGDRTWFQTTTGPARGIKPKESTRRIDWSDQHNIAYTIYRAHKPPSDDGWDWWIKKNSNAFYFGNHSDLYSLVIKHGNGKSTVYRWYSQLQTSTYRRFSSHVSLPKGTVIHKFLYSPGLRGSSQIAKRSRADIADTSPVGWGQLRSPGGVVAMIMLRYHPWCYVYHASTSGIIWRTMYLLPNMDG